MIQFSPAKLEKQIDILKRLSGHRWTIREIAKETGVSPAYLTFLKNGHRRNPSYEIVAKLAHFFNITPDELLETSELRPLSQVSIPKEPEQPFTKQTLEFCQRLLESNSPEQVIQFLSLVESSATEDDSFEVFVEKQLTKANAFLQLGQSENAAHILDRFLEQEMESTPLDATLVAKAKMLRGHVRSQMGNLSRALLEFKEALHISENLENRELSYLLHEALCNGYKEFEEFGLAIYHVEQQIRHLPNLEDAKRRASLYVELGQLHLQVMSLTAAALAFTTAEELNQTLSDYKLQGDLAYWRAKVHFLQHHYQEALELLQTSLQTRQAHGDHAGVAACLLDLASCYQKLELWELVESCAHRAAISFENMNERGLVARSNLLLVEAKHHLNRDPNLLLSMIEPVCEALEALHECFDLAVLLRLKANLYRALGRQEEALNTSMQALDMYHSIDNGRTFA